MQVYGVCIRTLHLPAASVDTVMIRGGSAGVWICIHLPVTSVMIIGVTKKPCVPGSSTPAIVCIC